MTDAFNLRLWLAGLDPAVLNLATFGLLALEGAGIPGIPGVLPMIAQVAAIDAGHTTLPQALGWGVAGNWVGSLLGYAAGRWGLRRLPRMNQRLNSQRVRLLLRRWGHLLIVVSRTIGSLRTPVTLVAGISRYPAWAYLFFSLLGAALHVGVWQTLLWKFGPAILPQLEHWGSAAVLTALIFVLLALLLRWLRQRQVSQPPEES